MTTARKRIASKKALSEFAHALADVSADAIRPYFRCRLAVENKAGKIGAGGFDPVTEADRAAERALRKAIAERYPGHGIVGEEYATVDGSSPYCWVIDPIDGTRAFITGSPLWGTLIGLMDEAKPMLGIMNQPFTGERVWSDGAQARWRQPDGMVRRLATRACTRLADATLTTTHPDLFGAGAEADAFAAVKARARMTRYGGDCYAYCLLAAGFIDVIVEAGLKPYDVVALVPIIEAAGGVVTTWEGTSPTKGGRILAAGDRRVHQETMALLASYGSRS